MEKQPVIFILQKEASLPGILAQSTSMYVVKPAVDVGAGERETERVSHK
jgi:hypothetical protein